jgi:hypothetical protein
MLWSQFSAKIWHFSHNQCYDSNFTKKALLVFNTKCQFFAKNSQP